MDLDQKRMKINMKLFGIIFFCWYDNTASQNHLSDVRNDKNGIFQEVVMRILTPSSEDARNLRLANELHILQPSIDDDIPFPCALNNTRSKQPPTSVHGLRPGDIDVVAAIGDSLVAGNGLVATNIFQVLIQNRGMSAFIGGQKNWRQYLTLPNILKEFNPSLVGYSLTDTFNSHTDSPLNLADASIKSKDANSIAKLLVKQMKSHGINFESDWKMVNLMIGPNDFCNDMCKHRNSGEIVERHRKDLTKALTTLRDNLPRTVVNVILAPHLSLITGASSKNRPPVCNLILPYLCPCVFRNKFQSRLKLFNEVMLKWQNVEEEVGSRPEFDTEDFTVVVQPFVRNYNLAKTKRGFIDYSVLSQDCFHLSQKENARVAISLWNNLLEPVGKKSTTPSDLYHFNCPSSEHPYIFTRRNSVDTKQ